MPAEQTDGRLKIRPRKIATSAEALADDVRSRVREVWGVRVYDTYGCTEYSPIAAECELGRKRLFEDGAVIEIERDRVLLTVLSRGTQPLIRHEGDLRPAIPHEREDRRPCGRCAGVRADVGWQVIRENGRLSVLLTGLRDAAACDGIGRSLREMLESAGAPVPPIRDELRGATGKAPLVVA